MQRMAQLETDVYTYQHQLAGLLNNLEPDSAMLVHSNIYTFIPATVVKNSFSLQENYLVLDKGCDDGIQRDMGVRSANGIVGVIHATSPHFSIAISLLHTKFKPNGVIKNSSYFGPVIWDGKDARYAYLTEIPRHVTFESGDTVVTSGYSMIFPRGIPIGSIVDTRREEGVDSPIRIRLFTDFYRVDNVLILANRYQKEAQELEERTLNLKPH
jgi:rod shape-determining protein MreC